MTNKNSVLEETKKVLEIMEESEENVTLLRKDLKQNEYVYEQIKQNYIELKEQNNKNAADLEDNQNLKINIKRYNALCVNFAQHIYSCCQELYEELISQENELEKSDEMINKNGNIVLEIINKDEGKRLKEELKLIKEEEIKAEQRKELDHKKFAAEKKELENELSRVNIEIGKHENLIKDSEIVDRQELEYEKENMKLQEEFMALEEEINTVVLLLDNVEKDNQKFEIEAENSICELDKRIKEVEDDTDVATKTIEENNVKIDQLNKKTADIEFDYKQNEEECGQHENDLNNMELIITESREATNMEIAFCENFVLKSEKLLKIQEEPNKKLQEEIITFKMKIKVQDEEINKMVSDIQSMEGGRLKIDFKVELETKLNELEQLKITRRNLKEKHNKKSTEVQLESKKLRDDIEKFELKNKKLQEKIDTAEFEVDELKVEEKKIEEQKEDEKSKQIDAHIKSLTIEIAEAKVDLAKSKQETVESKITASQKRLAASTSGNAAKKMKVPQHWDSDSSMEGVDKTFSERAKLKVRMMKVQGKKS